MATDMTTLMAGGGGALAALAGGALTPFIAGRREHRQWRREKLATFSEDLRGVLLAITLKFQDISGHLPKEGGPDSELKDLIKAAAGVGAYGPKRLQVAVYDLVDKYHAITRASESEDDFESRARLYAEYQESAEKTLKMMNRELRL
jgi:hypothetical protein